jgi:hypothetical protein
MADVVKRAMFAAAIARIAMRCTTPCWTCDAMRCDVWCVDRRQPKKHLQTTSHTQGELAPWEGPGIRRGELPRSSPRSRRRLTKDYAGDGEGGAPVCRSSERDRRETSQEPGQHCTAHDDDSAHLLAFKTLEPPTPSYRLQLRCARGTCTYFAGRHSKTSTRQ